jgi:hypothetical protein
MLARGEGLVAGLGVLRVVGAGLGGHRREESREEDASPCCFHCGRVLTYLQPVRSLSVTIRNRGLNLDNYSFVPRSNNGVGKRGTGLEVCSALYGLGVWVPLVSHPGMEDRR